ncbi:hypothetical protein NCS52_01404400 [Fusarium sp. LHS14.1]|nr:hypothetical protein NCS52_01404400 [Fusarium sp. LHS14.1]
MPPQTRSMTRNALSRVYLEYPDAVEEEHSTLPVRRSVYGSSASASRGRSSSAGQAVKQGQRISSSHRDLTPNPASLSTSAPTSLITPSSLSGFSHHDNQESLELDPIPSSPVMATPSVSSSPEPLLEYHHDPSAATLHCHCIQIPVFLGPPPTKLHVVQLCVHRNWCPSEDTQIHLVYDTATLSRTPLHPPPHLCTEYRPLDLWADDTERSPAMALARLTQPSSSPLEDDKLTPSSLPIGSRTERLLNHRTHLAVIFIMLLFPLIPLLPQGNLAWVSQSAHNRTAPFTFWEPIRSIYDKHETTVLPLVTPFEVSGPVPAEPMLLLLGLWAELSTISEGFASWSGGLGSLPPLPTNLVARVEDCEARVDALLMDQGSFEDKAPFLIAGGAASSVLHALAETDNGRLKQRANQTLTPKLMKTVFTIIEEYNLEALVVLQRIGRELRRLLPEVRGLLIEVSQSVSPFANGMSNRMWVEETIDAITYTEEELLPLISDVYLPLVEKAIYAFSDVDGRLADLVEKYKTLELTKGIEEIDVCYFQSDRLTWWSGWFLKRERISTTYFFDTRTLDELYDVAARDAAIRTLLLKECPKERRSKTPYADIRPPRPPIM